VTGPRRILWSVAAALVAGAGLVLSPALSGPALAAGCPGSTGVTVFVDPNQLGGEITSGCSTGGGKAVDDFAQAGYTLEYATGTGMGGFVCKINGRPDDGDCTQASSYWSLWWSDGRSGKWVYSSRGVSSLQVPEGGYVAFAWYQGSGRAVPPDVVPTPRVSTPSPTPTSQPSPSVTPTHQQPSGGKHTPSESHSTANPSSSVSGSPSASATASGADAASVSASSPATETAAAEPTDTGGTDLPQADEITAGPESDDVAHTDDEGGPIPTWAAVGLGVGVLGAAGAVPLIRRRLG
jgi:hypothetical protein